eukprot:GHVL01004648.1.p1 GENE.GHVL01004648.1~~GHVL01004648.1.p1  ORF type:complete len:161 (+),score=23.86 GHVL01004648.1:100-582(+)
MIENQNKVHVDFGDITIKNVEALRRILDQCLPITYGKGFYEQVLSNKNLATYAFVRDLIVGAICCRLEPCGVGQKRLYIMTIGVLNAYTRNGIGAQLLEWAVKIAKENNAAEIRLHVWVENKSAVEFYKKFNFEVVETQEDYYNGIDPPHSYVLCRSLRE